MCPAIGGNNPIAAKIMANPDIVIPDTMLCTAMARVRFAMTAAGGQLEASINYAIFATSEVAIFDVDQAKISHCGVGRATLATA